MNVNFTGKANFGPFVASYRAHPELISGLKERGLKGVPGSGNQDLAGIINDIVLWEPPTDPLKCSMAERASSVAP